jgi:hypothetical protein
MFSGSTVPEKGRTPRNTVPMNNKRASCGPTRSLRQNRKGGAMRHTAELGAIPAVVVALTVSPTATILTIVAFLVIQQVEGNYLMPRIHGKTLRLHPVLILLAVMVGGGLAGLLGVLLAVPVLAALRVLYDFFSVRLRTGE